MERFSSPSYTNNKCKYREVVAVVDDEAVVTELGLGDGVPRERELSRLVLVKASWVGDCDS